ncbi:MAG: helix-turn-helix transcriptional regulator [Spirochaetia bacterium]
MGVETRNLSPPEADNPKVHQLFFLRSGKGVLTSLGKPDSSGGKLQLRPGDLIFNPEGRLTSDGGTLRGVQIIFSEELFSPAESMDREALYVLGIIKLYAKQINRIGLSKIGTERVTSTLENMLWEFQERRRGYSWALRLKLIELLITVIRDKEFRIPLRGLKPLSNTYIQDVILYLNTEYMNQVTVEDILEICPLSRSHFHALFKQETGQTFIDYLTDLRCDRAADLLATTEKPIIDIAMESGFNNLSHFYHTFKERHEMSPKAYRNSVR